MKWKQERFVQEYLVDLDVAAAARRAGYHPKYGWELLRLPQVAAAVADGMAGKRRDAVVRQEEVLAELKKVAMAEASDANGSAVKVAGKLRALELLGKHLGLFEGRGGEVAQVMIVEDVAGAAGAGT